MGYATILGLSSGIGQLLVWQTSSIERDKNLAMKYWCHCVKITAALYTKNDPFRTLWIQQSLLELYEYKRIFLAKSLKRMSSVGRSMISLCQMLAKCDLKVHIPKALCVNLNQIWLEPPYPINFLEILNWVHFIHLSSWICPIYIQYSQTEN